MGTLWHGGKTYTMAAENETVEAIFTEGNKIIAAGEEKELRMKFSSSIKEDINLQGKTVLPGFTDSHMHLIGHGEKLMRLDFSSMDSHAAIKEALYREISETPPGEWIIGEGWNENQLKEGKMFDRTVLDELSEHHPIVLKRICRHAILANSAALELAGIQEDTIAPPGGIIGRNEDGTLNGMLMDRAQDIVLFDTIPPVSKEYLEKALRKAVADCFEKGLTGGHSEDLSYYGSLQLPIEAYQTVLTDERPFKAHLLIHHLVIDEFEQNPVKNSRLVEYGAMKVFADGSLGGKTALLSEPYLDDPDTYGVAVHSQEELNEYFKKARSFGREVAIHVIGDQACEMALIAAEENPPAKVGQRDRFIHAQILRPDLIERLQKLPVILDIQPGFTASDFPWIIEKLGADRLAYSFAWKTLIDKGIRCAGGSDAPIEPVDPLLGIHAAVTRKSIHTPSEPGYFMSEALTMFEAIKLYTEGSAYAIHREHERGKILPGYDADFTILARNPFSLEDPDQLLDTKVVMTVAEGKVVFQLL
ncbi:amidohydrolase [Metabacillus sp. 113a]|uniref:amidohydrolase n=1 Tax=Metabacillus sp. 113a TaxID=3404706 RepID=UPI003CEB3A37